MCDPEVEDHGDLLAKVSCWSSTLPSTRAAALPPTGSLESVAKRHGCRRKKRDQAADATGRAPRATSGAGFSPGGIERCRRSPRGPSTPGMDAARDLAGIRPASGPCPRCGARLTRDAQSSLGSPRAAGARPVKPPDLAKPTRLTGEGRLEGGIARRDSNPPRRFRNRCYPLSYWHWRRGRSDAVRGTRAGRSREAGAPPAGVPSKSRPRTRSPPGRWEWAAGSPGAWALLHDVVFRVSVHGNLSVYCPVSRPAGRGRRVKRILSKDVLGEGLLHCLFFPLPGDRLTAASPRRVPSSLSSLKHTHRRRLLFLLLAAMPLGAAERPNILFIMTDDHAAHAIGAYGSKINHDAEPRSPGARGDALRPLLRGELDLHPQPRVHPHGEVQPQERRAGVQSVRRLAAARGAVPPGRRLPHRGRGQVAPGERAHGLRPVHCAPRAGALSRSRLPRARRPPHDPGLRHRHHHGPRASTSSRAAPGQAILPLPPPQGAAPRVVARPEARAGSTRTWTSPSRRRCETTTPRAPTRRARPP